MPSGSLYDAASFMGAQARQLSVLALLCAIGGQNLTGLQESARKSWQKARGGWHGQLGLFKKDYYTAKKRAITGQAEQGVLSGGWKAYRCLEVGDVVLSEQRRRMRLTFQSVAYNAKERRIRQAYEGQGGSVPVRPWRNWPQRAVDLSGIPFDVRIGASIKRARAKYIKDAEAELPLSKVKINWQRLSREGRRLGTIRKQRLKIQATLRKAIEDAIQ